jgi:hypothetical protein
MREGERDENHKENCNYKEEGHVARLIVSVASHGRREMVGAGELFFEQFSLHLNLFKSRRREKHSVRQREIVRKTKRKTWRSL